MANDSGTPDVSSPSIDTSGSPDTSSYGGHETAADLDGIGDNWENLSGFSELTVDVEATPKPGDAPATNGVDPNGAPKTIAKPTAPAAATETKPTAPPAQATPQTQPQVQSASQPQPQPASQTPQASDAQPSTAGGELTNMLAAMKSHAPQLVDQVAKELFTMSPQMVDALNKGEGEKQFPRMFAHAYLRTLQTVGELVNSMVPRMIEEGITKFRTESARDQTFFQKFPQLNRLAHGKDIRTMAQTVRALNPGMSEADVLTKVGQAVMALHGIAAVAIPTTPTPPAVKPSNGFVPASAGRPTDIRSQPAPDSDDWSNLAL